MKNTPAFIPEWALDAAKTRVHEAMPLLWHAAQDVQDMLSAQGFSFVHPRGKNTKMALWTAHDCDPWTGARGHIERLGGAQFTPPTAHNQVRAPFLQRRAQEGFDCARSILRGNTVLLGGRTTLTFHGGHNPQGTPTLNLFIDGVCVMNQSPPVGRISLVRRLVPLLASLIALDRAITPAPAEHLWGWHNHTSLLAADTAAHAWFKWVACLRPEAPFNPAVSSIGYSTPYQAVNPDRTADAIADLRRILCPQGHEWP